MGRMIDKWHDLYHGAAPDYIECPHCQDAALAEFNALAEFAASSAPELSPTEQLPLPVVEIDAEVDWGAWLEATYDPDNERMEDRTV